MQGLNGRQAHLLVEPRLVSKDLGESDVVEGDVLVLGLQVLADLDCALPRLAFAEKVENAQVQGLSAASAREHALGPTSCAPPSWRTRSAWAGRDLASLLQ